MLVLYKVYLIFPNVYDSSSFISYHIIFHVKQNIVQVYSSQKRFFFFNSWWF